MAKIELLYLNGISKSLVGQISAADPDVMAVDKRRGKGWSYVRIPTTLSKDGWGKLVVYNAQILPSKCNNNHINVALRKNTEYELKVLTHKSKLHPTYEYFTVSAEKILEDFNANRAAWIEQNNRNNSEEE